jgi:hypothetical protein
MDPVSLTVASMAMTAAGGAISAAGTIAGGNAAAAAGQIKQAAANSQAAQETENAAGELASSQRRMLDDNQKTQLTQGTLVAKAAGSGFNAGTGSPLEDTAEVGQRGQYQALMDVFQGQNQMTGTLNKAAAIRAGGVADAWAGDETRDASYLAAAGTIAGSAGSMTKTYGNFAYPGAGKSYG